MKFKKKLKKIKINLIFTIALKLAKMIKKK